MESPAGKRMLHNFGSRWPFPLPQAKTCLHFPSLYFLSLRALSLISCLSTSFLSFHFLSLLFACLSSPYLYLNLPLNTLGLA